MADKPLTFTSHGLRALAERNIQRAWVEMTIFNPDWTTPDPRPGRIRAFRTIADARGKILRVVYRVRAKGS